jgi:small subunit ribosomal protein S15
LFIKTILYLKMARTHARRKGQSGSKRPVNADLSFVTLKAKEIEKLVTEFAKEDKRPSEIGLILRDTYGVPSIKKITGKSISKILEESKVNFTIPEDLQALVTKASKLRKHLENNTRDTHNKRGLQLIESRIRRLSNYYKRNNKLSQTWRYN